MIAELKQTNTTNTNSFLTLTISGKPQSAGIEGLGGDKNGYPTGMGAGAEPLGVFENEDTPIVDSDNQQQNIDDKCKGV